MRTLDGAPRARLAAVPMPCPALAAALGVEQVARVREAIMTALMRVGDEASVMALLPYLRSQDAAQRAASIEALQALPEAILPFMAALLADSDSDVRILATELARNMPAADATQILCRLLEHEQHPNVCAAAIDVLAEVGTRDAVPVLQACAERFAGNAVSAICRVDSHRSDFGHGTLGSNGRFRGSRVSSRPCYPGGGSASLRISLPPDRNAVRRQQALLH